MMNRSAGAGRDGSRLRELAWMGAQYLHLGARDKFGNTHGHDLQLPMAMCPHPDCVLVRTPFPDPLASSSETQGEDFNIRLGKLRESLEGSSKEMVIGLALQAIYDLNELRKSASSVPVRASGEPQKAMDKLASKALIAGCCHIHHPTLGSDPQFKSVPFENCAWCNKVLNLLADMESAIRASASPSDDGARQPQEVCICAALLMPDGYIVRGHRHCDAMQTAGGIPAYAKLRGMPQGFVTSFGRFVDRKEGARLQIAAGIESADKAQPYLHGELYSEDLY